VDRTAGLEQLALTSSNRKVVSSQTEMVAPALRPQVGAPAKSPRQTMAPRARPRLVILGGPDVDARLELMQALKDRFQVSALGSDPDLCSRFDRAGFPYDAYHLNRRTNPLSDLLTFGELTLILRRLRPDLVHAFDTKPNVWGRLAARLSGVPVVVGTLTGKGSLYGDPGLKTALVRLIYRPLQTLACAVSDLTILQNRDDQDYFTASGMVRKQKTRVIPGSGVSSSLFDPTTTSTQEKARLRNEFGLREDQVVVTMISRLIRSKGVLEFSAVAPSIRAAFPNARFLLVGPEDPESQDRLTAQELNQLKDAAICPGMRRDVSSILSITDIFALPTRYPEGIPRVLLEAASMGLPLVTTNSPGCKEVVVDGSNGILIEVGDTAALGRAILRLIRQPELRRSLGRASRERALRYFDITVIADQTCAMYEDLLCEGIVHRQADPGRMKSIG
jgi:glycosyltransferase involved in cell wall biosynthesis